MSPLELAAQLGTVREALEGLSSTTESAGVVMNMVHRDAWERVIRAHERALRAAGIE